MQNQKEGMGKLTMALLTAFVVIGLYVLALFLPNTTSIIALFLGIVAFLVSLYFNRNYRFFRIATLALFMLGLQKITPHLANLNFELNPSSVLFKLSSGEASIAVSDIPLALIVITGLVLDFLIDRKDISFNDNAVKLLIWGMSGIVIVLSIPNTFFSHNILNFQTYNFESGGTVTINNFSSENEFKKEYKEKFKNIENLLKNVIDPKERKLLEAEKKAIEEKLFNTKKALQEEKQLRKDSLEIIENLKIEIPSKQLEQAKKALQKSGDIKIAEQAFDEIVKNGSGPIAQAAFQSGKIAESRVDYAKAIEQYKIAVTLDKDNANYLLKAGQMAVTIADYEQAQTWLQYLLEIRQQENKDDLNLADVQDELANLYYFLGQYEKSEVMNQLSLILYKNVLGQDHPKVAVILNDLAGVYVAQGKYAEAEVLFKRSLAIKESSLGLDHPWISITLNNLADLYKQQGRYKEAEFLHKRDLSIIENLQGYKLQNLAPTLNNLAGVYVEQGKYEEAKPLYHRSLLINEQVFGKEHPVVAKVLNNLAELYREQGKYSDAKSMYQRSLIITEKKLGKNHKEVATVLNNLALLLFSQGNYKEAEPLYQRALFIKEKVLGENHPEVAMTLNNLAGMYESQGKYAEAEPLYKRAIKILESIFINGHPNIDRVKINYHELKKKMAEISD